ncbi:MAG: LamG-like jellyroll fold domain-containing protein [Candidatus Pacearchaeota archaeon]|jgi:prepilin-type N-terminal cleavage/methylation domain-containing protein
MNKLLKQAFTLIELLVVIAIIGILSGLIVVSMGGVTNKANVAKGQVFSNSLRNALMMNIVSEWKLNEGTIGNAVVVGDVLDTWSINNAVAVGSGPIIKGNSDCISGNCIQFDGVDDYIDFGDMAIIENKNILTISFWVKPITLSALKAMITKAGSAFTDNCIVIETGTSIGDSIILAVGNATTDSYGRTPVGTIIADSWFHILMVYDGTQTGNSNRLKGYINGTIQTLSFTGTIPAITQATSTNFNIGRVSNATRYFNGLIDDVRIYNAIIPTSQIKQQYFLGLNNLLINGEISREEYNQRINSIATNE